MKNICFSLAIVLLLMASCKKDDGVTSSCQSVAYSHNAIYFKYQYPIYTLSDSSGSLFQDTGSRIIFYYHDTAVQYWSYNSAFATPTSSNPSAGHWSYAGNTFSINDIEQNSAIPYPMDSAVIYLRYATSVDTKTSRICNVLKETLTFHF